MGGTRAAHSKHRHKDVSKGLARAKEQQGCRCLASGSLAACTPQHRGPTSAKVADASRSRVHVCASPVGQSTFGLLSLVHAGL